MAGKYRSVNEKCCAWDYFGFVGLICFYKSPLLFSFGKKWRVLCVRYLKLINYYTEL